MLGIGDEVWGVKVVVGMEVDVFELELDSDVEADVEVEVVGETV